MVQSSVSSMGSSVGSSSFSFSSLISSSIVSLGGDSVFGGVWGRLGSSGLVLPLFWAVLAEGGSSVMISGVLVSDCQVCSWPVSWLDVCRWGARVGMACVSLG